MRFQNYKVETESESNLKGSRGVQPRPRNYLEPRDHVVKYGVVEFSEIITFNNKINKLDVL